MNKQKLLVAAAADGQEQTGRWPLMAGGPEWARESRPASESYTGKFVYLLPTRKQAAHKRRRLFISLNVRAQSSRPSPRASSSAQLREGKLRLGPVITSHKSCLLGAREPEQEASSPTLAPFPSGTESRPRASSLSDV